MNFLKGAFFIATVLVGVHLVLTYAVLTHTRAATYSPLEYLVVLLGLTLAITLHEVSHVLVALWVGCKFLGVKLKGWGVAVAIVHPEEGLHPLKKLAIVSSGVFVEALLLAGVVFLLPAGVVRTAFITWFLVSIFSNSVPLIVMKNDGQRAWDALSELFQRELVRKIGS